MSEWEPVKLKSKGKDEVNVNSLKLLGGSIELVARPAPRLVEGR